MSTCQGNERGGGKAKSNKSHLRISTPRWVESLFIRPKILLSKEILIWIPEGNKNVGLRKMLRSLRCPSFTLLPMDQVIRGKKPKKSQYYRTVGTDCFQVYYWPFNRFEEAPEKVKFRLDGIFRSTPCTCSTQLAGVRDPLP